VFERWLSTRKCSFSATMRDLDSYRRDIKDALLTPRHFPDPAGQFCACPRPTHKGAPRPHRPMRRSDPPSRLLLWGRAAPATGLRASWLLHPHRVRCCAGTWEPIYVFPATRIFDPAAKKNTGGRPTRLSRRQRLMAGERRAIGLTNSQAIYGLGGIGKTRLAIDYA
jgi:hypothetical protein